MDLNAAEPAMCLGCLGFAINKSKSDVVSSAQDDGCKLVLGLGPTPTSYSDIYYRTSPSKKKETTASFSQNLVSETDSGLLELGLSVMDSQGKRSMLFGDEGSTSANRKSGGYMPSLLFAPRVENYNGGNEVLPRTQNLLQCRLFRHDIQFNQEISTTSDSSLGIVSDPTVHGGGTTSEKKNQHNHHLPKKCRFKGCSKGGWGASGLCISHGGGQRCQKQGCNKGAESKTVYCKAHGGGRRCQRLGCTQSAIAHGGGRRCGHPDCTRASRGKSSLCIRHGGGKRCTVEGCTRSAEGQAGLCISHGGGRRCQFSGCGKGAQGSAMYCKAHGGGRRCIFEGCTKGAEGSTPLCKGHGGGRRCRFEGGGVCPKSVHGGTDYCVAHGGGKRCAVPGCMKSARGRTDCCVCHGGGKRCRYEGCGKSAQGSTDFCKAHGGGKRCTWATGCEKFARGKSGLCAAHMSLTVAQQERNGNGRSNNSGMIGPGLFRGLVSTSTTIGSSVDNSSSVVSAISDSANSNEKSNGNNRQQRLLIPPQVLVPLSMKSSSSSGMASIGKEGGVLEKGSITFSVPEGRVHGGGLLSLLGGSFKNAVDNGLI